MIAVAYVTTVTLRQPLGTRTILDGSHLPHAVENTAPHR
jgi:hypothetical protein